MAVSEYVEEVEYKAVGVGAVEPEDADWVIFHCVAGDTYQAFWESEAWWLEFLMGDPSEGPFGSVDEMVDWLNDEDS